MGLKLLAMKISLGHWYATSQLLRVQVRFKVQISDLRAKEA